MMNLAWIIVAFLLILLNAFFVAAEFGMVKLRHTQVLALTEAYGLRGHILERIHTHLDIYLSACQVGITLASLGLGWVGEPAFAHLLEPLFIAVGVTSAHWVKFISFAIAFAFISFLHIVVGELMPKSLAIRQPQSISIWTAIPLYAFYWLMYPAIWLLNACSNSLLHLFGLSAITDGDKFYSTDEIKLILSASHVHGELSKAETQIIEQTLEFADLRVTEVMRPYPDMVALNIEDSVADNFNIMLENRFSRYPILDPKKNEIIGIIHVKDLFSALAKQETITTLQPFIRPVLKVNHHLSALELLNQFRAGMPHFALVYKSSDTVLGFVTLDNLLHVLIGRIKDEYHRTHEEWKRNDDGSLSVTGECSIYALEKALGNDIELKEDEKEIDVLAGLIIARLGRLPKVEEVIKFTEFDAVIEEIHGSHIERVKIIPITMKSQ